ncbi:MAG: tyrosine-protein phosphatase [Actinobacteria bacterium]|nr:tyrosine-protein phosphatase [Actinomycetota bacterium]
MTERRLDWEGCLNVRDLGGHPTEDGGETRMGAVVRADSVRKLTEAGWEALVSYGIRTILDLRLTSELEEDPPAEIPVDVVHVSIFDEISLEEQMEIAARWFGAPDDVSAVHEGYLEMLHRNARNFAAAISVVARAGEGGVLVHCAGGKDRTGLVSALLLRLAGVPIGDIAADYGLSAENLRPSWSTWVDAAGDDSERELRRRFSASPAEAMVQVLEELERAHGSVEAYLLGDGMTQEDVELARSRIRS